jgi:REP element-mobilizing transposase RayT
MSEYINKSHNVSLLLYHLVCPVKYRRKVITSEIESSIRTICLEISERYEINFLEIGLESNHVHFLIQSVPVYSPSKISQTIKSILARELFRIHPELKLKLWGGEFWTKGYFISTVSRNGNEAVIQKYVKEQGKQNPSEESYKIIYQSQLSIF